MKKALTIIAVTLVSVLAISGCTKTKVATRLEFEPSTVTMRTGDMIRVDFTVDGTVLPSGRTEFLVTFYGDTEVVSIVSSGDGYIFVRGEKAGTTKVVGKIDSDDPRDAEITGSFEVNII